MRCRNSRLRRQGCVDKPAAVFLDRQRGQCTGPICPSVDADTVRPLVDTVTDAVALHDNETVIGFVEQEGFPDPAQVRLALLFEFDSRPDSGVDEYIVAEPAGIDEAAEKFDMLRRYGPADGRKRGVFVQSCETCRVDAIAFEALRAAEPSPFGNQRGLAVDNSQQDLLMVAENEDQTDAAVTVGS